MFLSEDDIVNNVITQMNMISPTGKYQITYLRLIPRSDMGAHGHVFGAHIRNEYKLWSPDNPLTQRWHIDRENNGQEYIVGGIDYHPCHPDAVSTSILYKIWDKVNEVTEDES